VNSIEVRSKLLGGEELQESGGSTTFQKKGGAHLRGNLKSRFLLRNKWHAAVLGRSLKIALPA